ncbi:unnamed protein product [Calypogeia fissa]
MQPSGQIPHRTGLLGNDGATRGPDRTEVSMSAKHFAGNGSFPFHIFVAPVLLFTTRTQSCCFGSICVALVLSLECVICCVLLFDLVSSFRECLDLSILEIDKILGVRGSSLCSHLSGKYSRHIILESPPSGQQICE